MRHPVVILVLLLVGVLTLTGFVLPQGALSGRDNAKSALAVLFGDGRRLFANEFLSKADAYFHRGRYPSFFQTANQEHENHLVESLNEPPAGGAAEGKEAGHDHSADEKPEAEADATEAHAEPATGPNDWIARLANRFQPNRHVHLHGDERKEMLPWIQLSVDMDPHNVEAYCVGGYWLREMGKTREAEAFLREGQRNNPDSFQIYFELGRLYELTGKNPRLAVRLYELALKKWGKANANVAEPDTLMLAEILGRIGHLEEGQGDLQAALYYYTQLQRISPNPDSIQKLIDSVHEQMAKKGAAP